MRVLTAFAAFFITVMASAMSYADDRTDANAARDGSSYQRAIIVTVAELDRGEWEVAQMLRRHLDMDLHGFHVVHLSHMGRLYDVCELQSHAGKKVVMYFDVGPDEVPSPNQAMEPTADQRYA